MTEHPFLVLCVLVILAGALKAGANLRAGFRSRRGTVLRLRTTEEQQRFDPLRAKYCPKGYRKPRQ